MKTFFLSVHCDLPGCAAQWVSALLRTRQLHVAPFRWAFKKCLWGCGFLCVSEPLCIIVRRSWPTACCFLWDVALSQRGVCFRVSIVIPPICHCIKELKSGRTLPNPDSASWIQIPPFTPQSKQTLRCLINYTTQNPFPSVQGRERRQQPVPAGWNSAFGAEQCLQSIS